jgi:NTE family protein
MLRESLPVERIEDLAVPFQCVAASIERAAEHWFTEGPLADAVLASCAVPGLLPPVRIGDEHFLDGGLVHSIPVGRAVALGATTVYVLQVGRVEQPLTVPRLPWQVGMVAFEIARRHRYATDMASVPDGVTVHVLPVGVDPPRYDSRAALKYRDLTNVGARVEGAYDATLAYLASA